MQDASAERTEADQELPSKAARRKARKERVLGGLEAHSAMLLADGGDFVGSAAYIMRLVYSHPYPPLSLQLTAVLLFSPRGPLTAPAAV